MTRAAFVRVRRVRILPGWWRTQARFWLEWVQRSSLSRAVVALQCDLARAVALGGGIVVDGPGQVAFRCLKFQR